MWWEAERRRSRWATTGKITTVNHKQDLDGVGVGGDDDDDGDGDDDDDDANAHYERMKQCLLKYGSWMKFNECRFSDNLKYSPKFTENASMQLQDPESAGRDQRAASKDEGERCWRWFKYTCKYVIKCATNKQTQSRRWTFPTSTEGLAAKTLVEWKLKNGETPNTLVCNADWNFSVRNIFLLLLDQH